MPGDPTSARLDILPGDLTLREIAARREYRMGSEGRVPVLPSDKRFPWATGSTDEDDLRSDNAKTKSSRTQPVISRTRVTSSPLTQCLQGAPTFSTASNDCGQRLEDRQQERPPAAVTPALGSYPPDIRCQIRTLAAPEAAATARSRGLYARVFRFREPFLTSWGDTTAGSRHGLERWKRPHRRATHPCRDFRSNPRNLTGFRFSDPI